MKSVTKQRPVVHEITREQILALQTALERDADALTADDFETRHHFADGSYGREIELPAGTLVVGKIHKHAHVNVISQGFCLVATEHGAEALTAPCTFVSEPGTKRAVYAITDTVWTTVHVTDETDLEKIEEQVIAPSYDALLAYQQEKGS